jgi:subtilase family serine protease
MAKNTLLISKKTKININYFNGQAYIHFNQINGLKSFTLNADELITLFKKREHIIKAIKKIKTTKPKSKEIKIKKKRKQKEEEDSDFEEFMEEEEEEEEEF